MKSLLITLGSILFSAACAQTNDHGRNGSQLSSFTIGKYLPSSGKNWHEMHVAFRPTNPGKKKEPKELNVPFDSYTKTQTFKVAYGNYIIDLEYKDRDGNVIYKACKTDADSTHKINTPIYKAQISVCPVGSDKVDGTVQVTPPQNDEANVEISTKEGKNPTVKPVTETAPGSEELDGFARFAALNGKYVVCERLAVGSLQTVLMIKSPSIHMTEGKHKSADCSDTEGQFNTSLSGGVVSRAALYITGLLRLTVPDGTLYGKKYDSVKFTIQAEGADLRFKYLETVIENAAVSREQYDLLMKKVQ